MTSSKYSDFPIADPLGVQGLVETAVWRYPSLQQEQNLQQVQTDWIACETPVALVYNGISHVVMMATPKELEAFAVGFSLAEGIISSPADIYNIEIHAVLSGIEVHIELSSRCFAALKIQRRTMAGRTGCGVCGTEQIAAALKPVSPLPITQRFSLKCLPQLLEQLRQVQQVGKLTACTHAAAWISEQGQLLGGCEDIGRHVALDKLLGRRANQPGWQQGAVLISSRASYEMVQKAAICGVEIVLALSAATLLAIEVAERCQLTLVGFCRPDQATVYTHPQRLI